MRVVDLFPGADLDGFPNTGVPDGFVLSGGTLFFSATSGTAASPDRELWKTDGMEAGTVRVANINFPHSSGPRLLTDFAVSLYFAANGDGNSSNALWMSDGTAAGIQMVSGVDLGKLLAGGRRRSAG